MADKKLTALAALSTPADGDKLYIVDVSDTTDSEAGTSKYALVSNVRGWPQTSTESSAGVTPSDLQYPPGDVRRYGADLTGASDSTTALQAAMDSADVLPWVGTILIDNVTTTKATAIRGYGRRSIIKFATPSVAETTGLTLANAGSSIRDVHIDGNDTERSLVKVTAANCSVHITGENVDAGATTSGFQSGIDIQANNCDFSIYGEDFTNTGRSNESIPRLVTIQSTADAYSGLFVAGKDINGGVTIGSATGQGHIDYILCENAADNGIYQLGGANFSFGTLDYRGDEEACVCAGGNTVGDKIITRTGGTSALGVDNATSVHIGLIDVQYNGSASMDSFIRARSTNSASGIVQIDSMRGTVRGGNLMNFATGTTERLTLHSVDIEFIYDAAVASAITSFCSLTGLQGFDCRNWHVKIIDEDDVLTSSDYFAFILPTTNLARESYWENVHIDITDADETTDSDGYCRVQNLAQNLIFSSGVRWQSNIGPHGREANYSGGQAESSNAVPTAGTWRVGTFLRNSNSPSVDGNNMVLAGWLCTTAGTPGTWQTIYWSTVTPAT